MHRTVWLVVFVLACSSKSKEPPKREPTPASDAAAAAEPVVPKLTKCGEVATALCGAFERCTPHALFVKWNERANCEADVAAECASWAAPGSTTSDESLGVCISDLAVIKCVHFRGWHTTACKPPPGTLADGKPCMIGAQCASGSCRMDYKAGCRKCAPDDLGGPPPDQPAGRALGEACAADGDCEDGLACVKRRCTKPKLAELGAPCTRDFMGAGGPNPCRYGLECVDEGKQTVCKKKPAEGEACKPGVAPSCPYLLECVDGTCQQRRPGACKS